MSLTKKKRIRTTQNFTELFHDSPICTSHDYLAMCNFNLRLYDKLKLLKRATIKLLCIPDHKRDKNIVAWEWCVKSLLDNLAELMSMTGGLLTVMQETQRSIYYKQRLRCG